MDPVPIKLVYLLSCRGHCGSTQVPLTSLMALFEKWNDWAGSAFQMDKSLFFPPFCFPITDVSLEPFEVTTGNSKASYKFTESASPIALKKIRGLFFLGN